MRCVVKYLKPIIVGLLLLIVPAQFFAGPALYNKIRLFVLVPPEQPLPGVKQIAVLDFTGSDNRPSTEGARFTEKVIAQMLVADRGIHDVAESTFLTLTTSTRPGTTLQEGAFTNIFEVVERSQLSRLLDEQNLQASELVDETRAAEFGRLLGVQAIILGRVSYTYDDRSRTSSQRFRTRDGREYDVEVPCLTRRVTTTYHARIVAMETGVVLGSTEASESASESACANQPNARNSVIEAALPSPSSISEGTFDVLATTLANYVTPHFEEQELELEKITTREYRDVADEAAEAAEDLDVDEAYLLYWSIYEQDPYNPRVLYNLGLLNEVVGNYEEARDFYEMAFQLEDRGRYEDGLERVQRSLAFAEVLAASGVTIAKHAFRVDRDMIEAAMATEVEIKGRRENRVPVYSIPSDQGEVVAQVPGGVTFVVVEERGDWLCLQLLGGEQGWIHKDEVKVKD
jgi:tetratricopeptide (TPR) repeat protein